MNSVLRFVGRTPNRTFLLYPALIIGARIVATRGRPSLAWKFAPLLLWGYLQYRLCGSYRSRRGRGGPGPDIPPEDLVTSGPYAVVRNPMYLGHLIFLTGLALLARSRAGAALAAGCAWWFDARVREDEERLAVKFGQRHTDYQRRVGRWLPRLS